MWAFILLFLFPKTLSFAFSALFPGSLFLNRLRSPLLRVFGWVWTFTHCRNTEPSSVLVCCFWEVTDTVVVWIVDGRRVIIRRNHLVRLVGLMTCGVRQVGHVAKVILTVSEVHRTRAFWVWINPARVPWIWETDARCQRGYQKAAEQIGETSEGRRRDGESRLAHCTYLFHILEPCVCVHMREKFKGWPVLQTVAEKCACGRMCVHTPSHTR